jgi:hypothetical protein
MALDDLSEDRSRFEQYKIVFRIDRDLAEPMTRAFVSPKETRRTSQGWATSSTTLLIRCVVSVGRLRLSPLSAGT